MQVNIRLFYFGKHILHIYAFTFQKQIMQTGKLGELPLCVISPTIIPNVQSNNIPKSMGVREAEDLVTVQLSAAELEQTIAP